jgi:hypothetical protein
MRHTETEEQREARMAKRVAKREARQASDEGLVREALGQGWSTLRFGVDHRYILTDRRDGKMFTVNPPCFRAPTLEAAIAQARAFLNAE